jgi:two-component system, OmpR family, sensor histidine kinase RstB
MRRLYLRVYLAVLASLAVFALAAGVLWHSFADHGPAGRAQEVAAMLARNALPPAEAPKSEQQVALERLAADLRADVALFAADRAPLAAVGRTLPPPQEGRETGGWVYRWDSPPLWSLRLPDGRWLEARMLHEGGFPGYRIFVVLALLALAVGVGAYPLARRLTRRLERLQAGVESLGAGDLSARVRTEGHDEVARLARSFNRAAARIEELVGAHKALLANASHELRTPLSRIRMAVELMKESADPKRKADLEQDIAELDALIDEILLASRLDAARDLERVEDVDLLALAAEECSRYENVELDGRPATVRGDPRLLRRMIRNLLENAKRHGAPPVEVRLEATAQGAELAVCDRGAGVAEAERERVFEPFYRAGTGQGSGLGLALVRQIARRHGGEARCAPKNQRGSCFVVVLPQRE